SSRFCATRYRPSDTYFDISPPGCEPWANADPNQPRGGSMLAELGLDFVLPAGRGGFGRARRRLVAGTPRAQAASALLGGRRQREPDDVSQLRRGVADLRDERVALGIIGVVQLGGLLERPVAHDAGGGDDLPFRTLVALDPPH